MSDGILDSIHERCLEGVRQTVASLNLPGIPLECVYVRNTPDELVVTYPCVFITPGAEPETEGESDFLNDYVIYSVGVIIGDRVPIEDIEQRPRWLGWRRELMRHFRGMDALPGVPECFDVRVTTRLLLDATLPGWFQLRSGFTALCHTIEPRAAKTA